MSAIEKKIAYFIQTLPPDIEQELTTDQRREYRRLRTDYELIGQCFRAFFTGQNDPLEGLQILQKQKNIIWNEVDCLIDLWALIQCGFSEIKIQALKANFPFPFKTAQDLFRQALLDRSIFDVSFCLEKYVEISPKQMAKSAQDCLNRKPLEERDKRVGAHPHFRTYVNRLKTQGAIDWDLFSIYWCGLAYRQSPQRLRRLKQCLDKHQESLDRCIEIQVVSARRRGEWVNVASPAFAWVNGQKVYSKNGSYRLNTS